MPITLMGTTFSGHSFRTTIGNTLNNIFQMFYYLTVAGIEDPWDCDQVRVFASGDDGVIMTTPELEERICVAIRETACPDKEWYQPYGLG